MSGFGWGPFARFPWSSGLGADLPDSAASPTASTSAIAPQIVQGDYVFDENGNKLTGDPVDQEVMFRLNTVVGSFAGAPSFGNGVSTILIFTNQAAVQIKNAARAALVPMEERGVIQNLEIVAAPFNQPGTGAISFYRVTYEKTDVREID